MKPAASPFGDIPAVLNYLARKDDECAELLELGQRKKVEYDFSLRPAPYVPGESQRKERKNPDGPLIRLSRGQTFGERVGSVFRQLYGLWQDEHDRKITRYFIPVPRLMLARRRLREGGAEAFAQHLGKRISEKTGIRVPHPARPFESLRADVDWPGIFMDFQKTQARAGDRALMTELESIAERVEQVERTASIETLKHLEKTMDKIRTFEDPASPPARRRLWRAITEAAALGDAGEQLHATFNVTAASQLSATTAMLRAGLAENAPRYLPYKSADELVEAVLAHVEPEVMGRVSHLTG